MTLKTPKFLLILPELIDEKGHIYEYALSVQKALSLNGWDCFVAAPSDCQIDSFPKGWKKELARPKDSFWSTLQAFKEMLLSYKNTSSLCLFLEHFRLSHLLALFMACFFRKGKIPLFLLHRYAPEQMKCKAALHLILYRLFSFKIQFLFLTDSAILQKKQQQRFKKEVFLLPIPHGPSQIVPSLPETSFINCWWPGGMIRESKGLSTICKFSEWLLKKQGPLRLILAEAALQKGVILSSSVFTIPDELSRHEYEAWMHRIQIVLLPYDPKVYHSGTSGIFVEAICAGVTPFITEGTWMAEECKKYGLSALILQWDHSSVLDEILNIYKDPYIQEKLRQMRSAYLQFHCIPSFAKTLKNIAYEQLFL